VRAFYVHNALYWLEEFHLDGLRLDAVHAIIDDSRPHILEQIATAVRARFEGERRVHLVLENDANETRHLRADRHDAGYDAQWNDDLHHALHVIGTGETEGYYRDFAAAPLDHLGRALAEGFAWQGEPSAWRDGRRRGEPSAFLPPTAFVDFLQNHDQIGNRAFGERIGAIAEADALRALSAILLLAPQVPLLFMGQEWGSRRPFLFFCDFAPALATEVTRGRRREFAAFPQFADAALRERIPDPSAPATFEASRLDWHEGQTDEGHAWLAWHRHLLNLRREHVLPLLRAAPGHAGRHATIDGRVLRVRWTLANGRRLTLIANLHRHPAPLATADGGCRVFETATANGELPAWYVAWHVENPPT
jgi:malto-oligosyltrehalose trehalohydrolase